MSLAASKSTQTSMDTIVASLAVLTSNSLVPGNAPVEYIASNVGQYLLTQATVGPSNCHETRYQLAASVLCPCPRRHTR